MADHLHLAVALTDTGWHPASWREVGARPQDLFTAGYWVDLVREAERGLADFVTIEDGLRLQSDHPWVADDRTDRVRGRLDATLVAARVGPATTGIGLVPTVVVNHTEPFHASKAIATLDYVSSGRGGVRVQLDGGAATAGHFGRRETSFGAADLHDLDSPEVQARIAEAFDEAGEYVEVLRRLWDSWEDDAEIRDVASGRFVDRARLHHIDFEGRWFSVKGPSITPRPPQGQPLVTSLGHADIPYRLIARSTDVGFVTPRNAEQARGIVGHVRAEQEAAGRADETVHVFGDVLVVLDDTHAAAQARRRRLDEVAPYESDALVFAGTPLELADLLEVWAAAGLTGFRLRPAVLPHDLSQVVDGLVPELQRRGLFRTAYDAGTLRGLLGLGRPVNRYATV
ncbi:LLM class flavin-dependent oxidoreductase [Nocardioides sp. URHA0020]|uniref:LLM class flavin-dependent oxidoreductase n=1 Tax=Nocardioides sp. URHA0020 TaxID=1380392 RepID=UPI00048A4A82|nr:LLM class flavin-dependent oxidoreductase [Nocardioides sp. URHA0020]